MINMKGEPIVILLVEDDLAHIEIITANICGITPGQPFNRGGRRAGSAGLHVPQRPI